MSGQIFGFGLGVGVGGTVAVAACVGDAVTVVCNAAGAGLAEPAAPGDAPPPHEPATTAQTNRTTVVRRATITTDNRIGKRRANPLVRLP